MLSCLAGMKPRLLLFLPFLALSLSAETMLEFSNETRLQLDLNVNDEALAAFLPKGWTSNPATEGAARACNLRAIFIDRVTINGPDGAPKGKGSNRLVLLAAPVKDPQGQSVQLVIGGLTEDPSDAPGPFGNYLLATTHSMQRVTQSGTSGGKPISESLDWVFAAGTGERLEVHITYQRGVAAKRNLADTKYYSARNPSFYQISRQEQVLDIMRNVTTKPEDHVVGFSFRATGGSFSKLFELPPTVLSWDNVLWLNRSIIQP